MRGWLHIKAAPGMGLEEQFCLRWQGAPVAVLKPPRNAEKDLWTLSLLNSDRMHATTLKVLTPSLLTAKAEAERMATEMGWSDVEAKGGEELRKDAAE